MKVEGLTRICEFDRMFYNSKFRGIKAMGKTPQEWFKQAAFDIKNADIMFNNKSYVYAVFLCHLAIEKALKGLYTKKFETIPPKTHNLIYLVEKIEIVLPEELYDFIFTLNGVSVPTRYPEDLKKMQKHYNKTITQKMLEQSKEALKWLRAGL